MGTLISVLIIALIAAVAFWGIDRVGFPGDFAWIVKAIVLVIVLLALLKFVGVGIAAAALLI